VLIDKKKQMIMKLERQFLNGKSVAKSHRSVASGGDMN